MIATVQPREVQAPASEEIAGRRIHFLGAGGIGVSALMELAQARGAIVSGCDCCGEGQVAHLREIGIEVQIGHDPAHVEACDEVVYSPAVPDSHPELVRARELGKAVSVRMAMLGRVTKRMRTVCVTGSHGKTTMTWMIAHLLVQSGRDPSVLVGGVVPSLGSNVRVTRGPASRRGSWLVMELDESDNRMDRVQPALPVVTNIDADHMEHYGSLDALEAAMADFLASAAGTEEPTSALVGCGDDERVLRALKLASQRSGLPAIDYGFGEGRAFRGLNVALKPMCATFDLQTPGGVWRGLELPMPGRHNVLNAVGAAAAAHRLGLDESSVRCALATCERVGRRFEIKGEIGGVRVVDDYGHHPTEIAATVRAACEAAPGGRVGALFQPHRYTRTAALMDDFARVFAASGAAKIWLLPVYAASEAPIAGADHKALAKAIRACGYKDVTAVSDRAKAAAQMAKWAKPGDTLLVQGAGDVTHASEEVLALLRRR